LILNKRKFKELYNKLKDIANMSRRFYKREIDTRCTSKGSIDKSPLMCGRDINEILSPLNVCIEAPKYEKPLKKRMPDKSQLNIYTYQIQPKATPTISYKTSLTVMINTLHILAMLVKPEKYFDEVIEGDEEATTKYAFIPE
jgi:hypothetical protein